MTAIPPGSTIGILGGGQLGRMLAIAAARLGYRVHIYAPEAESPAAEVAAAWTRAPYDDHDALARFAAGVAVVTYEFENVPAATVAALARHIPVRPNGRALATAQDRGSEKDFVASLGIGTAPYAKVAGSTDLAAASRTIGAPAILKRARLGYDGRGQARIGHLSDLESAWRSLGEAPCVLEGVVPFVREISVLLARGADGRADAFDIPENTHDGGILRQSRVPAPISPATAASARDIAARMAVALEYVGVIGVELFELADGRLLVNEFAPRVHNSGHWTIDACVTDQFEQHIRAVCGLPLGSSRRHSDAVMTNLLGDDALAWAATLAEPAAKLHLYGKSERAPGRKMGHVTRVYPLGGGPS